MSRKHITATRDRAYARIVANRPGTIQFGDGPVLDCGVTISIDNREQADGGFVRIRTAAVFISKAVLPTIPELAWRAQATITCASEAQDFRLMESHDQTELHWFLRFAKSE